MSHLLSTAELSALPPERVRLLDVRWWLGRTDGHDEYLAGHIPGAVFVDLERDLSGDGAPQAGRHPLPSTAHVQDAARRWGLNDGDAVVVYDAGDGLPAARAWWLLRHGGVDVRVLDGGWGAWTAGGGAVETGERPVEPGTITLADVSGDSLTIDEAAAFPSHGVLIDVRAAERFRGEAEPIDPVAGHIPGAVNLPIIRQVQGDPDALRAELEMVGVAGGAEVGLYCGSGITAARSALALAEAGIDARIFHGSWSQWANTPGRPIATGA